MPTVDTGTGTQANNVIAVAQSRLGETVPNVNWCANFVSEVFKSAGLASSFPASSRVKTIVSEFSGKTSTDISTAKPGDLIVFGNQEHIMLYEGSGQVIGTITTNATTGTTKVVETAMSDVITVSGSKGPSMVIHTGLDGNSAPVQVQGITANFGLYFKALAANPMTGYTLDHVLTSQDVSNWAQGMMEAHSGGDVTFFGVVIGGQGFTDALAALFIKAATLVATPYIGKPISALPDTLSIQNSPTPTNMGGLTDVATALDLPTQMLQAFAALLGKFTNPANWLHAGAMLLGVGLVGFGMWTVVGDLRETGPQGLVSPMPIILKEGA